MSEADATKTKRAWVRVERVKEGNAVDKGEEEKAEEERENWASMRGPWCERWRSG